MAAAQSVSPAELWDVLDEVKGRSRAGSPESSQLVEPTICCVGAVADRA